MNVHKVKLVKHNFIPLVCLIIFLVIRAEKHGFGGLNVLILCPTYDSIKTRILLVFIKQVLVLKAFLKGKQFG